MKTGAEREQTINDRSKPTGRKKELWVRDKRVEYDIVQVPVDALVLNPDNRRFRAERMWAEERLDRSLDPENHPEDERNIESLLLDTSHRIEGDRITGSPSNDYKSLREDWLRRGQDEPFWIRPDGNVRNGNRRLAMLKRLQREGGDSGLQYVQAIVLSVDDIDEPAMLEMEQREQLTENFKVRYNDIDYLLALREAAAHREVDWFDTESIDTVAGQLQSMVEKSKGEVIRDLYAVKYMDLFLEDMNQEGQYHRLLRTLERFRDIGRMMVRVESDYPLDADKVIQVLFAAVRSGQTHNDIRVLRQMFRNDRDRFDALAEKVAEEEAPWAADASPTLVSPSEPDDAVDEDEDDNGEEGPGPEVANYPKEPVTRAIQGAIDGFDASRQEDVLRTLNEVRNRLESLSVDDRLTSLLSLGDAASESARGHLATIVEWVDTNRDTWATP